MTHRAFDPDRSARHDDPPDPALDDVLQALPPLRPSRDLWPEISARLDARSDAPADTESPRESVGHAPDAARGRVLAFRTHTTAGAPAPRRRWLAAAAAVALMAASSGATYLAVRGPAATQAAARPAGPPPAADAPRLDAAPATPHAPPSAAPKAPPAATPDGTLGTPADAGAVAARGAERARSADATVRAVARRPAGAVDVAVPGAADYDREIAELRGVVAERHSELDSATVAVLARNLRIIDAAIAASRAALARDPHSPFLGEQLTRALGQKVDLLRTAALLPRT